MGTAKIFRVKLGLILNKVLGRNSPVTKMINVEIIVWISTNKKWLSINPASKFCSMTCAINTVNDQSDVVPYQHGRDKIVRIMKEDGKYT